MRILLDKVSEKVKELIISHNQIIEEKNLLINENKSFLKEIKSLKEEINSLNNYINEIRVSNSLKNNENDNSLAKKKINMFLREIDKCIALLNN